MHKVALYILFSAVHGTVPLYGQLESPIPFIEMVNEKIAKINQGFFDCTYKWKSSTSADTSSKSARVYFFKKDTGEDSICRFIIMREGGLSEAYDGKYLYYVDNVGRNINVYLASEKGGVVKTLRKNFLDFLAFRPYILQKQAFNLTAFQNAIFSPIETAKGRGVSITVLDSFKNQLKLLPSDPDMTQVEEIYEFELPDAYLLKKQEIIKFSTSPQFLENNLSPISSLPDSISFEDIFDLRQFQSNGYKVKEISKSSSNKPSEFILKPGDTLMEVDLVDLDGNAFSSKSQNEGLILFDFWYKGCAPCLMAMPILERLHQKYGDKGLKVFGINGIDKNPVEIKSFLKERSVTYQTLVDTDKKISRKLQIENYPTMILFDVKTSKILMVHTGFSEEIEAEIVGFLK